MNETNTGRLGEAYAAAYLKNAGLQLIKTNFYSRYGEIDIIAADEQYLLFVEVKARMEGGMGTPAEAVNYRKQKKIVKTATYYLMQHPSSLQPRFDVVEIVLCVGESGTTVKSCNYIENAFDAG